MEKIQLVEDDPALCELLKKVFQKTGYTVFTAANGHEALESLSKNAVDLVITDIMMPKMGGLELIEILAKDYPQMKVLTLSGVLHHYMKESGDDDMLLQGVEEAPNVVFHLKKPFKIEEILALVEKILHK